MIELLQKGGSPKLLDTRVYSISREISDFFGCPRVSFDVETKPSEENGGMAGVTTTDGFSIHSTGENTAATFHTDKDRNVITVYPATKDSENSLRHEAVHGYHFHSNESVQRVHSQLEKYASALQLSLISPGGNNLSTQSKEILASLRQRSVKYIVACEALAHGYVDLKDKEMEPPSFTVLSDAKDNHTAKELMSAVTNYNIDPNVLSLTPKDVIPFLQIQHTRAYWVLGSFTNRALFIDESSDPAISTRTEKDERVKSGIEKLVSITYKALPPSQVEDRLREWFTMDCIALADRLIRKNTEHYQRAVNALTE
ncbi:MAG: hypothetical protein AABW48_03535 [Nanoarchaeota archaeon]